MSFRAPIEADKDWAILRLHTPICREGLPIADTRTHESETQSSPVLSVAAVHLTNDGRARVAILPCQTPLHQSEKAMAKHRHDFANPDALQFHDCKAGAIASGAPLLTATKDGPNVTALHVGTYVRSRIYEQDSAAVDRIRSTPVTQIAIKAQHFAHAIRGLFGVVTSPAQETGTVK